MPAGERRGWIEACGFFPSGPARRLPPARPGAASGAWAGWANASVGSSGRRGSGAGLGRLSGPLGEAFLPRRTPLGRACFAPNGPPLQAPLLCKRGRKAERGSLGTAAAAGPRSGALGGGGEAFGQRWPCKRRNQSGPCAETGEEAGGNPGQSRGGRNRGAQTGSGGKPWATGRPPSLRRATPRHLRVSTGAFCLNSGQRQAPSGEFPSPDRIAGRGPGRFLPPGGQRGAAFAWTGGPGAFLRPLPTGLKRRGSAGQGGLRPPPQCAQRGTSPPPPPLAPQAGGLPLPQERRPPLGRSAARLARKRTLPPSRERIAEPRLPSRPISSLPAPSPTRQARLAHRSGPSSARGRLSLGPAPSPGPGPRKASPLGAEAFRSLASLGARSGPPRAAVTRRRRRRRPEPEWTSL